MCESASINIAYDYLYTDYFVAHQSDLFAGSISAASLRAIQLRQLFAAVAYVLMAALRRIGLGGTVLAKATCGANRLILLMIGAPITKSVRRVKVSFATGCLLQREFAMAHHQLCRAAC